MSLGLNLDCWEIVFRYLDAYDVAFLYFSGDLHLRRALTSRVQVLRLPFNPYRRVSWPRNFFPLFPRLNHFAIGDPSDPHGPMVPEVDLRVLPSTLKHLGLHIGNATLALIERVPSRPGSDSIELTFLNIKALFPQLEELHWNNTLHTTRKPTVFRNPPILSNLPPLLSLTMSLLPMPYRTTLGTLPPTLQELRILTCGRNQVFEKSHWAFPPELRRLELFSLELPVFTRTWPSQLEYLRLEFRIPASQFSELVTLPLPETLRYFRIYAPELVLSEATLVAIPSNITTLKLHLREFDHATIKPSIAHFLPRNLQVLHLCSKLSPSSGHDQMFKELPSTLREFIVTTSQTAPKVKSPIPPTLAVLRSNPPNVVGWHTFPPEDSSPLALSSTTQKFPMSLLDMEDSVKNLESLPPTLTRLSLQSYPKSPVRRNFTGIAALLPNLTDLTLCTEYSFRILEQITSLPLSRLAITYYYHSFVGATEYEAECIKKATSFDLNCFVSLRTLEMDLRFIDPKERTSWLDRLPPRLTDLSLIPYESRAEVVSPGHVYTEAWVTFPRLPRSLTRFAGCLSDLHSYGVFGYLPNSLTELYIFGFSVQGALATGSPARPQYSPSSTVFIDPTQLFFLPTSLKHVMLPQSSMDRTTLAHEVESFRATMQQFYASRPQLSLFGFFFPSHVVDSRYLSPHALVLPSSVHTLFYQVAPHIPVFHSLQAHLPPDVSVSRGMKSNLTQQDETVTFRRGDYAVRRPLDDRAAQELRYRWKASKIAKSKSLSSGYSYLHGKLAHLAAAAAVEDQSKSSSCSPS